jgi:threonine/homoserine/homoserine lactone efflux protein
MGEAIGQILPLAVGVALSPIPIIAVVLMLVTRRARSNGPAFVVGWLVGLAIVGAIMLAIASGADANEGGEPATWASVLELVVGAMLLSAALRRWRGRPAAGGEAETPKWMQTIDGFSPAKSFGAGVVLSGVNPKNLLLAVAAANAIAQTGISGGDQAVAYAVFAVLGTLGVGIPVVLYFVLGERSKDLLERLKGWMSVHNAAIMAVLFLVIGAKLVGSAIGSLT